MSLEKMEQNDRSKRGFWLRTNCDGNSNELWKCWISATAISIVINLIADFSLVAAYDSFKAADYLGSFSIPKVKHRAVIDKSQGKSVINS